MICFSPTTVRSLLLLPLSTLSSTEGKATAAPTRLNPGVKLKIPKTITNTAEKVIKYFLRFPLAKLENAPTEASAGNVPKENANMVNAPTIKLPVPKTYNCNACVKPHGKKKVAAPN